MQFQNYGDYSSFNKRDRPLKKVGTGVGYFRAARIFFVNISLAGTLFFFGSWPLRDLGHEKNSQHAVIKRVILRELFLSAA